MGKRRRRTTMQVVADRVGLLHAARVFAFMAEWNIARADLGGLMTRDDLTTRERARMLVADEVPRITVEDFAEFWGVSRANAYRDWARFRRAFEPEDVRTPEDLYRFLDLEDPAINVAMVPWPA